MEKQEQKEKDLLSETISYYTDIMNLIHRLITNDMSYYKIKEDLIKKLDSIKESNKGYSEEKKIIKKCKDELRDNSLKLRFSISQGTAPGNTNKPCQKCFTRNSQTAMLICGHYFCKSCLLENHGKHYLLKCLLEDCYHVISNRELQLAIETESQIEERKKRNPDTCVFCSEKAHNKIYKCKNGHQLCEDCFKKYGEYETNYEILIFKRMGDNEETDVESPYKSIPCSVPGCRKSFKAEILLKLYTGDKKKVEEDAKKRHSN